MTQFKKMMLYITFYALTFAISLTANAQKYKTAADTLNLNKEYASISLDISKLTVKLVEAQNKTNGFQSNSASSAQDAVNSAQQSKTDASTATNGNLDDAKTAMKQARKANNQAKDAKNAKDDENDNIKTIKKLNDKIAEKQQLLADLDKQRMAIKALPVPPGQ
ncbi:hypothetical protein [Mucilaginibacter sp.]|jgi:hypothetical protein|uniref:hypothetical protein n=1 Tax=Mucilaginibacter sp. TaxID=1882438 RepID=UPI002BC1E8D7|nr:hypothetical protein [Mucilaginibacter sp.]HTI58136.1 hypothetical protein [Mucilaginibacter sp.]